LPEAEFAARKSVSMLREGGEASVLAESLTTLGVVLSRGGNAEEAKLLFVEAKETALGVGDNESAGNAVLTQIEELQSALSPADFNSLYLEADELLQGSPEINVINRLKKIARKQFESNDLESEKSGGNAAPVISWENFYLPEAVRTYEGDIILKALSETSGRVTRAAKLLGLSHQNLSLILHQRHKELHQHRVQRKSRGRVKIKTH
jgi:DNA-binding NtrC family response regulator